MLKEETAGKGFCPEWPEHAQSPDAAKGDFPCGHGGKGPLVACRGSTQILLPGALSPKVLPLVLK